MASLSKTPSYDAVISLSPKTGVQTALEQKSSLSTADSSIKTTQQVEETAYKRSTTLQPQDPTKRRGLVTPPREVTFTDPLTGRSDSGSCTFNEISLQSELPSLPEFDVGSSDGRWSNKTEMMLALLAFVVGLGNVWSFPYLCLKYGRGTFLILFLLFHFVIGLPLVYIEFALGQFSSCGPIRVFANMAPLCQGIGWATIFVIGVQSVYYNIVMAWSVLFLFASFDPPWRNCNNTFNTHLCISDGVANCSNTSCNPSGLFKHLAAHEFFDNYVYSLDESGVHGVGGLSWQMSLCLLLCWLLTLACVIRGVPSFGIVVYFSATLPILILLSITIHGFTLSNAREGIWFLLEPSVDAFSDPYVWARAAVHALFTTSPAVGTWITLGSYNRFNNNCFIDAIFVIVANGVTSILAAFALFSVLGQLSWEFNVPLQHIEEIADIQLVFVLYPQGVYTAVGGSLCTVLFFVMLALLGLNTQFIQVETVVVAVCEQWPWLNNYRPIVAVAHCVVFYLLGLPMCTEHGLYLFNTLHTYSDSSLTYPAFIELVCVFYIYGWRRMREDIKLMIGDARFLISKLLGPHSLLWIWMWFAFCPPVLFALQNIQFIILGMSKGSIHSYNIFGSVLLFSPLTIICVYGCVRLVRQFKSNRPLSQLIKPTPQWCPAHKRPHRFKPNPKPTRAQLDLAQSIAAANISQQLSSGSQQNTLTSITLS